MEERRSSQTSAADVSAAKPLTIGWGLEPAMHAGHDYLRTTGHTADPERDYRNFRETGAKVARSGLRTRIVNPEKGVFDFGEAEEQALAAKRNGIFVYWDLAHYDYPRWIKDPWGDEMVEAFVGLGLAFADRMSEIGCRDFGMCVWNETILWSSWMGTGSDSMTLSGAEMGERAARWQDLGIKAAFAVMRAVRERHPGVKFLLAEPCFEDQIFDFLVRMKEADPVLMDDIVIGLNVYPNANLPKTLDAAYYVEFIASMRRLFPRNEIIISETSSAAVNYAGWDLPDRVSWFESAVRIAKESAIDTMIWYPALNYGAWNDESAIIEHGGWNQDEARTEFSPLVDAVREANGAKKADEPTVFEEEFVHAK